MRLCIHTKVPEAALEAAFKPFTSIQGPLSQKYRLLRKEFEDMNQVRTHTHTPVVTLRSSGGIHVFVFVFVRSYVGAGETGELARH
jgi:hypothetical protein